MPPFLGHLGLADGNIRLWKKEFAWVSEMPATGLQVTASGRHTWSLEQLWLPGGKWDAKPRTLFASRALPLGAEAKRSFPLAGCHVKSLLQDSTSLHAPLAPLFSLWHGMMSPGLKAFKRGLDTEEESSWVPSQDNCIWVAAALQVPGRGKRIQASRCLECSKASDGQQ